MLANFATAHTRNVADRGADGRCTTEMMKLQLVVNVWRAISTPFTHVNGLVRILMKSSFDNKHTS